MANDPDVLSLPQRVARFEEFLDRASKLATGLKPPQSNVSLPLDLLDPRCLSGLLLAGELLTSLGHQTE